MSEKVRCRLVESKDMAAITEIYRYYVENTTISFEYEAPSLDEMVQRKDDILAMYPYFVAEDDQGKIIGYAYAKPFGKTPGYQWAVESTVYLCPNEKGRGAGRLLYETLEAQLIKQNIYTINASITKSNEESQQFHEKLGYKKVALYPTIGFKLSKWLDVVWMQKTISQPKGKPANFVPFSEWHNS